MQRQEFSSSQSLMLPQNASKLNVKRQSFDLVQNAKVPPTFECTRRVRGAYLGLGGIQAVLQLMESDVTSPFNVQALKERAHLRPGKSKYGLDSLEKSNSQPTHPPTWKLRCVNSSR